MMKFHLPWQEIHDFGLLWFTRENKFFGYQNNGEKEAFIVILTTFDMASFRCIRF